MSVIDASVWVSRAIDGDLNHAVSERWITRRLGVSESIIVPVITIVEIAGAIARRTNNELFADAVVHEISTDSLVELVDVSTSLAESAARLASLLKLRGMDAIYATVARERSVDLVTWDEDLITRAASAVRVCSSILRWCPGPS